MNIYQKRQRNLYDPKSKESFAVSRSKIDMYLKCPRCFYLDRRLGLSRPSMPGWSLNSAVDELLKNEFDLLRKKGKQHDLMTRYKINAIPFDHPEIDKWRENFVGKQYLHEGTNLLITGAVDDIWINKKKQLLIIDYKATSTTKEISLEDEYKKDYKKQMEVYQWIFRKSGFNVSDTGYFIFANAGKNRARFDGRLEFELSIIPHKGDDTWVEPTIHKIKKCLESNQIPASSETCEFCTYRKLINKEMKV